MTEIPCQEVLAQEGQTKVISLCISLISYILSLPLVTVVYRIGGLCGPFSLT